MLQQVLHGDLGRPGLSQRRIWVDLKYPASWLSYVEDVIIEIKDSVGDEFVNRGGGNRLCHARDSHHHVLGQRYRALCILPAEDLVIDDLTVLHDSDGGSPTP